MHLLFECTHLQSLRQEYSHLSGPIVRDIRGFFSQKDKVAVVNFILDCFLPLGTCDQPILAGQLLSLFHLSRLAFDIYLDNAQERAVQTHKSVLHKRTRACCSNAQQTSTMRNTTPGWLC